MTDGGVRGRGAAGNPANRFTRVGYEPDGDLAPEERPSPQTVFLRDTSRSLIATNDSPDVGFEASINPYRGCEHGCAYCYARPTHEYFGFSAGLDFETKILVKEDAPDLLRRELMAPKWVPKVIAISGVTDAYQPIERTMGLTRRCLEVLAEFRNPCGIVTKNRLVTRDADVLSGLAAHGAVAVHLTLTTLDADLARALEPRASSPARRLDAIRALKDAGVPVGVMVAPVIPGLTDHEIPAILDAAAKAGARWAGWIMLRLPHGVAGLFEDWLGRHAPTKRGKVLNLVRDVRGGALNDPLFGSRMRGQGPVAEYVERLFRVARKRAALSEEGPDLSTAAFRRPAGPQLTLFGPA